jgi:hypothetical protein
MPETKSEADIRILNEAKVSDNEVSQINIRNSSSVHPVDCNCQICKNGRFDNVRDSLELKYKQSHNLYIGDENG